MTLLANTCTEGHVYLLFYPRPLEDGKRESPWLRVQLKLSFMLL